MDKENNLAKKHCKPCSLGAQALNENEIKVFLAELQGGWHVINDHHLEKKFHFPDFQSGLDFTNKLGELAESEGHHPDIYLTYGLVTVTIWTHKVNCLTKNDFILAAKCDELITALHKPLRESGVEV